VPPLTREKVTGGSWPAQIWGLFEGAALAETPIDRFPLPAPGTANAVLPTPPIANVIGMPIAEAEQLLTDTGYRVARRSTPNRDYPPGIVVAQNPAGGVTSSRGTLVTLDVASGSPPSEAVPTLLGLLSDQAKAATTARSLGIRIVVAAEPPPGSPARAGRVWKQAPVGGASVDAGSIVTIWVNPSS
jgi:beta-lactam-binding protein with PASTA domain